MKSETLKSLVKELPLNFFKSFVAREVAIGFIERTIEKADINYVLYLIENDIYNIFTVIPNKNGLTPKVRKILKPYEQIVKDVLTPENVLQIISEIRPDVYSLIINHPKGQQWIQKSIEHTLKYIFEY